MAETKHTPGPWTVGEGDRELLVLVDLGGCGDGLICSVARPRYGANARLIAAAPDMLAALEGLVCVLGECGLTWPSGTPIAEDSIQQAELAIAKATGE